VSVPVSPVPVSAGLSTDMPVWRAPVAAWPPGWVGGGGGGRGGVRETGQTALKRVTALITSSGQKNLIDITIRTTRGAGEAGYHVVTGDLALLDLRDSGLGDLIRSATCCWVGPRHA
jgi:hypothetical protein